MTSIIGVLLVLTGHYPGNQTQSSRVSISGLTTEEAPCSLFPDASCGDVALVEVDIHTRSYDPHDSAVCDAGCIAPVLAFESAWQRRPLLLGDLNF